jgi:hypothetical protein
MLACSKVEIEAWLDETVGISDHQGLKKSWASLWNIKVSGKLKIFLWRLAQLSLPTMHLLHHRHNAPSRACGICGAEDSWRHSFLDCAMALCVWSLADEELVEHMCQTQEPDAPSWLFSMFDSLPRDQLI